MIVQFSAGPWHVGVGGNLHANRIWTKEMRPVAQLCSFGSSPADTDPTAQANGRLLAAAPELLAALEDMFALMDEGVLVRDTSKDHEPSWSMRILPIIKRLQNNHLAIAKARGLI